MAKKKTQNLVIPPQEKCYAFYDLTKKTLEIMASQRGISTLELKKYYSHTDQYCDFYDDLSEIPRIFAQMLFHVQNATMISNIVKFKDNYHFLKEITCNFVPNDFLKKYENVDSFVNALRYNENSNPNGLVWDSSKSENKDSIAKRFAKAAFACAEYLNGFSNEEAVLEKLKGVYEDAKNDEKKLINYFRSEIKSGFSIALTCDFLKEFNEYFEFLPKPDIHIKDAISALNGRVNYYHTESREIDLIKEVQKITELINNELKSKGEIEEITVYQLDRMIWLICSGKFFLHDDKYGKGAYIYEISKL